MKIQPPQRQDTATAPLIGRFGRRRDYLRVSVMDMLKITGSDSYASIMAGQQVGKQVGFEPIKLNMVVIRSDNAHKI